MLLPPGATRPSLVVDTVAAVDGAAAARLRDALYGLGCSTGILFDAQSCVILRDTFRSMEPSSIVESARVATREVLRDGDGSEALLDARVERWLHALSTDWDHALPLEPGLAAPFLEDIVPVASGSVVRALRPAA